MGTGSKNFASESLGMVVGDFTPTSTPWAPGHVNSGYGKTTPCVG